MALTVPQYQRQITSPRFPVPKAYVAPTGAMAEAAAREKMARSIQRFGFTAMGLGIKILKQAANAEATTQYIQATAASSQAWNEFSKDVRTMDITDPASGHLDYDKYLREYEKRSAQIYDDATKGIKWPAARQKYDQWYTQENVRQRGRIDEYATNKQLDDQWDTINVAIKQVVENPDQFAHERMEEYIDLAVASGHISGGKAMELKKQFNDMINFNLAKQQARPAIIEYGMDAVEQYLISDEGLQRSGLTPEATVQLVNQLRAEDAIRRRAEAKKVQNEKDEFFIKALEGIDDEENPIRDWTIFTDPSKWGAMATDKVLISQLRLEVEQAVAREQAEDEAAKSAAVRAEKERQAQIAKDIAEQRGEALEAMKAQIAIKGYNRTLTTKDIEELRDSELYNELVPWAINQLQEMQNDIDSESKKIKMPDPYKETHSGFKFYFHQALNDANISNATLEKWVRDNYGPMKSFDAAGNPLLDQNGDIVYTRDAEGNLIPGIGHDDYTKWLKLVKERVTKDPVVKDALSDIGKHWDRRKTKGMSEDQITQLDKEKDAMAEKFITAIERGHPTENRAYTDEEKHQVKENILEPYRQESLAAQLNDVIPGLGMPREQLMQELGIRTMGVEEERTRELREQTERFRGSRAGQQMEELAVLHYRQHFGNRPDRVHWDIYTKDIIIEKDGRYYQQRRKGLFGFEWYEWRAADPNEPSRGTWAKITTPYEEEQQRREAERRTRRR